MKDQTEALKLLSMDELIKKRATLRSVLIGSCISMALLIGILIYLAIIKDQYVLLVGAICLPLTIMPSLIARKNINNEIAERS